jgi:hypothetical protein
MSPRWYAPSFLPLEDSSVEGLDIRVVNASYSIVVDPSIYFLLIVVETFSRPLALLIRTFRV